jgi:crossover junction endodeoxyribonuclease RuvC
MVSGSRPAARVLGLDPGSRVCGYGVVEERGQTIHLIAAGILRPHADDRFELRLQAIHQGLVQVMDQHQPDEVAVEGVFQAKNARSALLLGHARGVALLAAAQAGLVVYEYPPASVKKALVGGGRAAKEQVRTMVATILNTRRNLSLDASDALAVAITHLHSRRLRGLK